MCIVVLFITAKTKNRCLSTGGWTNYGILYNEIMLANKKEQSTDIYTNMAKTERLYERK